MVNQMGVFGQEQFCFFPHLLYPLISTRGLKNIKNVFGREAKSQLRDTHFVGGYSLNLYPSAVRLNKQTNKQAYYWKNMHGVLSDFDMNPIILFYFEGKYS